MRSVCKTQAQPLESISERANHESLLKVGQIYRDGAAEFNFHIRSRNQIKIVVDKEAGGIWYRQINGSRQLLRRPGNSESRRGTDYPGSALCARQPASMVGLNRVRVARYGLAAHRY